MLFDFKKHKGVILNPPGTHHVARDVQEAGISTPLQLQRSGRGHAASRGSTVAASTAGVASAAGDQTEPWVRGFRTAW